MMEEWPGTTIKCVQVQTINVETGETVKIPTLKCFEAIFVLILRMAIPLATLALFVMLIIGGFKYLTSAGDQKAVASAKQTITHAIAGIVLMVLAFLIFRIIEYFTGIPNLLKFEIPSSITPAP